ncbi:hypothetical protein Y1Q_0001260 [Alligator mississippiensis]|uniref:Uncharacterized protein n=1 Tax=Alligator mississippiensis TaxID=8496 RepID=A0A151M8T2_ALLMI|nr:hypothetical protein Y1Q_0001260 [Alligator mississippiensis]
MLLGLHRLQGCPASPRPVSQPRGVIHVPPSVFKPKLDPENQPPRICPRRAQNPILLTGRKLLGSDKLNKWRAFSSRFYWTGVEGTGSVLKSHLKDYRIDIWEYMTTTEKVYLYTEKKSFLEAI